MNPNYIAGEWVSSTNASHNINPSNLDDVIGDYARADDTQVQAAIEAAAQAFPAWSRSPVQSRADSLDRVGNEILARREELGDLLSREEGKILPEAIGEVMRAGNIFKYFAAECIRSHGQLHASVRAGIDVQVTREPVGVVGILTPWNFPIAIPAWKIAPALAYGNCVVFKPADLVPGSSWMLASIIANSGIPTGVFNLVMGRGAVVGQAIVDHPTVAAITFTGSTATGHGILQAGAKRRAKIQLEMGGKNALVVLDDANVDLAVKVAVDSAFYSTGQRCTAASRLIVQSGIHDAFVAKLTDALKSQVIDDARKAGTTIGPVVDAKQLEQDLRYIALGRSEGATLAVGGEAVTRDARGHYLTPALFTNTHNNQTINREEIFGPVATVIRTSTYEEALVLSNESEYGLCAGICTQSLKYARHFQRNADVGMVMVNLPTAGVDYHVPFGGRKASSYGPKEQGQAALEFFTMSKTTYVNA